MFICGSGMRGNLYFQLFLLVAFMFSYLVNVWKVTVDAVWFQDDLHYEIIGAEQPFYYLNPESGKITLKRLFTEGRQTRDEVREL